MANKKKAATTVVAVATAAALLLGGTFAWQSISQTALNEASDVINPGGRLHNDLWYVDAKTTNNDIYVENFTDAEKDGDDIYARVRLSEYMEIVMNYGTAAEKVENVAGSKTLNGAAVTDKATDNTSGYEYDYTIHYFGEENATDTYWEWTMGNEDSETVYYMPTFNLNKDSLAPDLNGLYAQRVGGISNREMGQYVDVDGNALEDYEGYSNGELLTGFEIYDGDTNSSDEIGTDPLVLADIIENGETSQYNDATAVVLTDDVVEHEAKPVGATKGLVSIEEWLGWFDNGDGTYNYEKYENGDYGNYWVYDTDGWVYWSGAIGAGETTGLLLDSFTLNQVMDDTWYYAIEAEGEFVTADDLGEPETAAAASTFNLRSTPVASETDLPYYTGGTGFYENGISKEALALLSIIGVGAESSDEDEGEGEPDYTFDLSDALPEKAPVVPLNSTIAVNAPVEMANPVLGVTAYKPYNLESFPIVDDEVDISGSKLMNSTSPIGLTINEDYTYENGLLTITNPEYVNTVVALLMSDGPAGQGVKTYKHAIFVVEGESSGGEESYDLLLTENGENSLTVAIGDGIKIKVADGIEYDRISVYAEDEEGEGNNCDFTLDEGVLKVTDSFAINKKVYVRAQTAEEVYDPDWGDTYMEYTTVASAELTVTYRYQFYYDDAPVTRGTQIKVTADDLLNGIEIPLWDIVDNEMADATDYDRITEYVWGYSGGEDGTALMGDLYGMVYEDNVLKITTKSYDGSGDDETPHDLTAGDRFIMNFEAYENIGVDEGGDDVLVELAYVQDVEIIILGDGGEVEPKGAMYSGGEVCGETLALYKTANYFGSDGYGIDFSVADLTTGWTVKEDVTYSLSGEGVSGTYEDGFYYVKSTTPTAELTGNDSFTFTVTMTWGEETYSCDVTVYIVEQNLSMNYNGAPYASGSGITETISGDHVDSTGEPMYFNLVGSKIKVNGIEYEPSSRVYAVSNYTDVEYSYANGVYRMSQSGVTAMELNETTGYLCVNPCYNSYSVDLAVRSNIDLDGDGTEETVESIITLKVNLV